MKDRQSQVQRSRLAMKSSGSPVGWTLSQRMVILRLLPPAINPSIVILPAKPSRVCQVLALVSHFRCFVLHKTPPKKCGPPSILHLILRIATARSEARHGPCWELQSTHLLCRFIPRIKS